VSGLTVDDFEVFENGKPQVITTFTPVNIPTERPEPLLLGAEPDVQTNTRTPGHVYLVILAGTPADWALRARYLMRQFIDAHFGDNDIAAVITGRTYPGDRQDFTNNRRLLLSAVDRFNGESLDVFELADLMEMTARIPGSRKVVVWFGTPEGVDAYRLIDYRGDLLPSREAEAGHAAIAAATRGNIRWYLIDPRGLTPAGGLDQPPTESGSPGVSSSSGGGGGFAQANSNTFAAAFERLVRETSTYYLLGFESTVRPRTDGRYVRLEVKAKRPGLTVRSRTGYLDPLDYNWRRAYVEPERTPIEAALANPMATPGVGMRVSAAPYRRSGRNAIVALAIDLDATHLAFVEKNGLFSANVEVRHLATDVNHKIFPEHRHRTTVGLDAANVPRVKASGVRIVSQFEVPSGRYQVRVASSSGQLNGSVVYDLEVPDFTEGPLTMSGVSIASLSANESVTLRPETSRRSNQRSKQCRSSACEPTVILESGLRAWRDDTRGADPHVLQGVLPAPPTTERAFAEDETLVLFTEVYDNNGRVTREPPYGITLTAALHDSTDTVVREVSEERSSRAVRRPSGGHGFTVRFPLQGAAPGSYVLRVGARSDKALAHTASRSIPIRVQ
jgi:VWFA-related protein